MKVRRTEGALFYHYLTEREIEFRMQTRPLRLVDVAAVGASRGEFEISEEELDALVEAAPRVALDAYEKDVHHHVWIGKWELGMTVDRKLVYAKDISLLRESSNPGNIFDGIELGTHCAKCHSPIIRGAVPYKKVGDEYYHEWCLHSNLAPSGTCYYHGTESYKVATIKIFGLTPQPVPEFVRGIVNIDKGVYLSQDKEFVEDLVSFHYDEGIVLAVTVPDEGKLISDPELGDDLPKGYIYPDTIPPEYIRFEG